MRIDVVDDARGADQIMTLAFHAERMLVQKRGALRAPALRAVERPRYRITLALVVLVALALVAPASRAMDRRTNGHDGDLDDANGNGGGNNNAREGSSPSRALLSRA